MSPTSPEPGDVDHGEQPDDHVLSARTCRAALPPATFLQREPYLHLLRLALIVCDY